MCLYDGCQGISGEGKLNVRFTLITHAATEAQRLAAFPQDEPLLEPQTSRLSRIGWSVSRSVQAWSGPEMRARETAHLLGLEASVDDSLRDCGYGHWRGQTMEAVQSNDPDGLLAWLTQPATAPHGGESIQQLVERVSGWMQEQTADGHIVAVTHPSVVRAAMVHALHLPLQSFWRFDIAPMTLTDLRLNRDIWTVRSVGCALDSSRDD
jgi:broad specificity phosphatase PhoE